MRRQIFTIAVLTLALPSVAFAACLPTDLCAKVTGLTDTPLGTWGGSGDLTSNYTHCVYVQNDNEVFYKVTGTGTGAGSAYIISSGANDISITIDWEEDSAPGWVGLLPNIGTNYSNPETINENCAGGGGNTAKLRVTIPAANMDFATAGSYSGTVTVLVSPD